MFEDKEFDLVSSFALLEHIDDVDPFTIANFKKLLDGSNADCCHVHSTGSSGTFDGEHNDLDGLNDGDYIHLTAAQLVNFTTLTDGSNADALHIHNMSALGDVSITSVTSGDILSYNAGTGKWENIVASVSGVHNDLDGLQGGTALEPSAVEEYYHLDYNQYISLVGGPSIGADEYHTHNFPTTAYELPLGETCDGDWDGGLFPWDEDYLTSCALDDVNEVLGALAPPAAPLLDDIGRTTSGVTGDLSFDASNPIAEATYVGVTGIGALSAVTVDNSFANSGDRIGIIDASTDVTGILNDDVVAHEYSYPANAFGNGELGNLILELNGVEVRNIDLTTAGAVDDGASTTGFTISDKTPCEFSNGYPFVQFQYRTGTYRIDSGDMNNGWNYARVIHRIGVTETTTNYVDWVVDANASATSYSGIVFDNLIMTNNGNDSDFLSGVEYWREGTADYDVVISNGQRNTYITGSAITFTETNGTVSNQAFLNTSGDELQQRTLTDLTFTINSSIRLLNANITNRTSVNRTINANEANSSTSTIASILMDDLINHTATANSSENFNGEGYRLPSNVSLTSTSYASGAQNGPVVWDPQLTIADAGSAGYNNGLLVYNSSVRYPTQGLLGGDFRDDSDGGSIAYSPSTADGRLNMNYSTGVTGEREYLCYFYDSSSRQNFTFNFTVNNTTFVAASNRGSLSGNNVTCEILAPNTTDNGSPTFTVEFKDMVTPYTADTAIGAYYSSFGSTIPTNWGVSLGGKATADSGYAIVVRITAPASWAGYISNISCTFL